MDLNLPRFVLLLWLLPLWGQTPAPAGGVGAGTAPGIPGELLRIEGSLAAMGTTYTITLYGDGQERVEAALEAAFNEVRRVDGMLSNYRPDSEWSEVNRYAAERPVKVTPELFDLLSACVEFSRQSEGAFDVSVGPLMRVSLAA